MKQIRKRLTYANVMSSIAVFLVLGGATAFAATKIGSKEIKSNAITTGKIKKEAVTTAKIKNNAINGAKVNESSLGQVPSAANADNAGNANTVGGTTVKKIFYAAEENTPPQNVLSLNGLTLTASCPAGTPSVVATTSVNDSIIHSGGTFLNAPEFFYEEDDSFEVGNNFTITAEVESDSNQGTLTYANPGGGVVTVVWATEEDGLNKDCVFAGHANS